MRTVRLRLLPPDENGLRKVRIHWFVRDENGPVHTGSGVVQTSRGPKSIDGAVGYIACKPQEKDVTTKVVEGVYLADPHSDDPRAVTCPECLATEVHKKAMEVIESLA